MGQAASLPSATPRVPPAGGIDFDLDHQPPSRKNLLSISSLVTLRESFRKPSFLTLGTGAEVGEWVAASRQDFSNSCFNSWPD